MKHQVPLFPAQSVFLSVPQPQTPWTDLPCSEFCTYVSLPLDFGLLEDQDLILCLLYAFVFILYSSQYLAQCLTRSMCSMSVYGLECDIYHLLPYFYLSVYAYVHACACVVYFINPMRAGIVSKSM